MTVTSPVVCVNVTSQVVKVTKVSSVVTCSEVVVTVSGGVVVFRVLGTSDVVVVRVLGISVEDVWDSVLCEVVVLAYGGKVENVLEVSGAEEGTVLVDREELVGLMELAELEADEVVALVLLEQLVHADDD